MSALKVAGSLLGVAVVAWSLAAHSTPSAGFAPVEGAAATEASPVPSPSAPGSAPGGPASPPAGTAPGASAPTPGSTAQGTKAGGAPAAALPVDGSTYAVRLRDLEARVDELKHRIRRSHTRLSLLSETILAGGIGGARAEITLMNELSGAFKIVRALVVLDGAVQFNKQDDQDALKDQNEIPVFSGSIPPGDHTLQVLVKVKGHGYGVFSYLRGYEFELKSSHAFTVTDGKTVQLKAIAWEKGGVTTPLEQRPALRYVEKIRSGNEPSSGGRSGASPGGS